MDHFRKSNCADMPTSIPRLVIDAVLVTIYIVTSEANACSRGVLDVVVSNDASVGAAINA